MDGGPLIHKLIVYCPILIFEHPLDFVARLEPPSSVCFCLDQSLGSRHPLSFSHTSRIPKKQGTLSRMSVPKLTPWKLQSHFTLANVSSNTSTKKELYTSYHFHGQNPTISLVDNETETLRFPFLGCSSIYSNGSKKGYQSFKGTTKFHHA